MRLIIRLVTTIILAAGVSFSQQVAPNEPNDGEKLIVSEISILREPNEIAEEGFPITANYRVIGKITNRSNKPAIQPVFHVSLDSSPLDIQAGVQSIILMPQESAAFFFRHHTTPENLEKAKTAIIKLTGDPFSHAGWDRKLENVPKLSFKDAAFRKFPENQFVTVSASFQNNSGLQISRVMATAVFLDKEGRITDAGPFTYNVHNPHAKGTPIGFPMPGVKETDRCIIEVNNFEESK